MEKKGKEIGEIEIGRKELEIKKIDWNIEENKIGKDEEILKWIEKERVLIGNIGIVGVEKDMINEDEDLYKIIKKGEWDIKCEEGENGEKNVEIGEIVVGNINLYEISI